MTYEPVNGHDALGIGQYFSQLLSKIIQTKGYTPQ